MEQRKYRVDMEIPKRTCACHNRLEGTLVSTTSSDFPHVAFVKMNGTFKLYLFPQSLYFVESRTELSKSQRARLSMRLTSGDQINFLADKNDVIYTYDKALTQRKRLFSEKMTISVEAYGVISNETPRRIWCDFFGVINYTQDIMNFVPNIVYKITVALDVNFKENLSELELPIPYLIYELGSIIDPYLGNNFIDLIYSAPWNLPDPRNYFQAELDLAIGPQKRVIRPTPPRSFIRDKNLYVLDNCKVIWPAKPKFKVVLGNTSNQKKSEHKVLKEGLAIIANTMFYCEYNNFYVVTSYRGNSKKTPLRTRMVIDPDENTGTIEYYVILRFSRFKNFFISGKLNYCLIDDPKHLLTNFIASESKRLTFPAWIRFKSFETVAKFSVTSLDLEKYDVGEIYEIQDIVGSGFLVNNIRGTVYSWEYPNEKIFLMITDRAMVKVGEIFTFRACFYRNRSIFVIYDYSLSKNELSLDSYYSMKGFLFLETLNCTKMRSNQKVYFGKNLGLVTDLDDLILTEARRRNAELPAALNVLVEENTDEQRCTMFNVYALELNLKEVEHEDNIPLPPTPKWWQSNDARKCKCQIIREIMEESRQMLLQKNSTRQNFSDRF